jgi:hypothetical protein
MSAYGSWRNSTGKSGQDVDGNSTRPELSRMTSAEIFLGPVGIVLDCLGETCNFLIPKLAGKARRTANPHFAGRHPLAGSQQRSGGQHGVAFHDRLIQHNRPMPTKAQSSRVQAWIRDIWPMVTFAPIKLPCFWLCTWITVPSWMLVFSPIVIFCSSPRNTQLNQTPPGTRCPHRR